MVNKIVFLVFVFSLVSCNTIELKRLETSTYVKVPKDDNFFKKYDKKVKVALPSKIDLKAVYEYAYLFDFNGRKFYDSLRGHKSMLKFYKKGRVNYFHDINSKDNYRAEDGYRGVCYQEENGFKLLLVVPVKEDRRYGIKKYNLNIKGDTLFITDQKKHYVKEQVHTNVYVKKNVKVDSLKDEVDW